MASILSQADYMNVIETRSSSITPTEVSISNVPIECPPETTTNELSAFASQFGKIFSVELMKHSSTAIVSFLEHNDAQAFEFYLGSEGLEIKGQKLKVEKIEQLQLEEWISVSIKKHGATRNILW